MMQINLKLWQIYPLFAKSKFSSNFNRHIKFSLSKAKFLNKISQNLACRLDLILKFKAKFICYNHFAKQNPKTMKVNLQWL